QSFAGTRLARIDCLGVCITWAREALSMIEWLALGVIVFAVVLVTLGKYLFPANPVVAPVIQDASSE
ncbi:hypothetical protein ACUOCP_32070, partial [Escherichia sp. R-CC3]